MNKLTVEQADAKNVGWYIGDKFESHKTGGEIELNCHHAMGFYICKKDFVKEFAWRKHTGSTMPCDRYLPVICKLASGRDMEELAMLFEWEVGDDCDDRDNIIEWKPDLEAIMNIDRIGKKTQCALSEEEANKNLVVKLCELLSCDRGYITRNIEHLQRTNKEYADAMVKYNKVCEERDTAQRLNNEYMVKHEDYQKRIEELEQEESEWKHGDECVFNGEHYFFECVSSWDKEACILSGKSPSAEALSDAWISELSKPLTEEQKKEKEREDAIQKMLSEAMGETGLDFSRNDDYELASILYDLDYRKVENPE